MDRDQIKLALQNQERLTTILDQSWWEYDGADHQRCPLCTSLISAGYKQDHINWHLELAARIG